MCICCLNTSKKFKFVIINVFKKKGSFIHYMYIHMYGYVLNYIYLINWVLQRLLFTGVNVSVLKVSNQH